MSGNPLDGNRTTRRLQETLLGYLHATGVGSWPGVDGLTVDDVVAGYPQAVAAGSVPDWQQLLREHPDLDAELHRWLAKEDRWEFAFRRAADLGSSGRHG
jgi:hypothetical protein